MSFSSDVKKELCVLECENECCQRAEAYGMIFFGRAFEKNDISIMTDYDFVAERYTKAVESLIYETPKITISKSGKITLEVSGKDNRMDILNELGYSGSEITYRLLKENVEKECCFGAFLRGVFLSCGIITNPKKEYHLEFDVAFRTKCRDLAEMFNDFSAEPKFATRNGMNMLYFKDSSYIEDILTVMGAQNSCLELIGEKILKNVRNNVNRKVNCDNANIRKTCAAAAKQNKAIESLIHSGKFDDLSSELKELAKLRLNNPEMTLCELGASLSSPISRSGVNHRLRKLISIATEQN